MSDLAPRARGGRVVDLLLCFGALTAPLVACGDDDSGGSPDTGPADTGIADTGAPDSPGPMDAGPDGRVVEVGDFSCQAMPWPSTAPDPLQFAGAVAEFGALTRTVGGATLEVLAFGDGSTLETATTAADGTFAFSFPTGGAALDIYTRASAAGFVTTYDFPAFAFFQDETDRHPALLPDADFAEAVTDLGVTVDPTKSVVIVVALDCNAALVPGVTVTFSPPAEVVGYYGDDLAYHLGNTTTEVGGTVLGFNVPPGPVEATLTLGSRTWRARTIQSYAASVEVSRRRP